MYEGYKQALKDYNLGISKKRLIGTIPEPDTYGEGEYQLGKALGQMLLERDYLPDAIVTINDITAIGVINYLYSEGIQVPHVRITMNPVLVERKSVRKIHRKVRR